MQYIHYILMFKVHHNACRPFTQKGHHTRDIFNWECGFTSLQRWWFMLVIHLLSMLSERRAHLPYTPATQSIAFESLIGCQKCNTVKLSLTAPRYTGVIPATYAGPCQLGSEGLPPGKCAWVMQVVNKSLRVELLLTFKHLLTV